MTWRAPAIDHLFDQRLQTARLELMEDNRVRFARHRQGSESTSFLCHLMEEKFAATALTYWVTHENNLRHRSEIACEYPVHLCRQYEQALKDGVARYEAAVKRLADGSPTPSS